MRSLSGFSLRKLATSLRPVFSPRILIAFLLLLACGLYFFFQIYTSRAFDGGTGTPADPYIIGDCTQLQEIDDQPEYLYANYILANDVDCSAVVPFETIGNYQNFDDNYLPFMGRFDGQGNTISNVTVGDSATHHNGIFATIYGGSVRNLNLDNITVEGTTYVGALAGEADDSAIIGVSLTNSSVTLYGNSAGYGGGIIGRLLDSYAYGLHATTTSVIATGTNTTAYSGFGGLVGSMIRATIERSTAGVAVTANFVSVGGVVGAMQSGSVVKNVYSDSVVVGYTAVGGVVGSYSANSVASYIDSVYSNASTTATTFYTGGILGGVNNCCSTTISISNSFAVGKVASTTLSGGISGVPAVMDNNVYYPTGTGQTRCIWSGAGSPAGECTSNDTSSYYNDSSNLPMTNWDFVNVWSEVVGNRPILQIFPYSEPGAATAVGTCADLAAGVRANPVGWFELSSNIDCAGDASLLPLTGNAATSSAFYGIFDGQGYTISGITMSRTAPSAYLGGIGLFTKLYGSTVNDVTLAGGGVTALTRYIYGSGALAAYGYGLVVNDITSTVPVHVGEEWGGGLIGYASGYFDNINVTADIDHTYPGTIVPYWIGGIFGSTDWVQLTNSTYTGDVYGYWYAGGIVGYADLAFITNATTSGSVTGNVDVGGIAAIVGDGINISSSIDNAHSSMLFTPDSITDNYFEHVGGIVGMGDNVNISNSSYTGTIELTDPSGAYMNLIGGIAGSLSTGSNGTSTISNSYTDAYILVTGSNGNEPYIENVGGLVGEAGYLAITDSIASTTMRFGADNPSEYTNGFSYIGGLVGITQFNFLDIRDSEATGSIYMYDDPTGGSGGYGWGLGGFGGYLGSGIIQNSTSSVDMYLKSYEPGAISNFVGDLEYTSVTNVVVDGDLTIDAAENPYYIGGLAGYADTITVATTTVLGDISVTNTIAPYDIGGLIGYLDMDSTIQETYTNNNLIVESSGNGSWAVAGFVGEMNSNNTFTDTYASTSVTVTSSALGTTAGGNIGGYAGYIGWTGNSITNSYSSGALSLTSDPTAGFMRVGGFIGWSANNTNTYTDNFTVSAVPAIASSTHVGGFIGRYTGSETFSNNAYDATETQRSLCTGLDLVDPAWCSIHNVASAEPTYFYDATNEPMLSWNFTTTWLEHPDTYPTFGVGGGGGGSTPPTVTTTAGATSITQTGADIEGNITNLGSGTVTERGFVHGLTPLFGATTSENSVGFSTGIFTAGFAGLVCNTTYYFAAYASGTDGSDYGTTESFTTSACGAATPPTVSTSATVSSITQTSATLSGNITALGSATITTRGFAYGVTTALGATTTENSAGFSTGVYAGALSSLSCGTTYYFVAYATGADGTGYGSQQSFTTSACTIAGSSGGGTKVKDKTQSSGNVLGKLDSITICHSADGSKYVTLTNVQVFITQAESGAVAELRGHDGHGADIIAPFTYDLGQGIKTYSGNNWTPANQKLYANNCELFLKTDPPVVTPPITPTPKPRPLPPAPPEPISVCDTVSVYTQTTTVIDRATTVRTVAPQGAVRSVKTEEKGKKNYELKLSVKPVENKRADELKVKFVDILNRFQEKKGSKDAPAGILKKIENVTTSKPYTESISTLVETTTVSSNVIPVVTTTPCGTEEEEDVEVIPVTPPTPAPVPVVSPDVPAVIVSDVLASETIENWLPEEVELLVPPIQVVVETPEGEYLETFETPMEIEIVNPDIRGLSQDDIFIMQPSSDGTSWYEVPFEVDGDTLTITIERPGEYFVWFLPREVEAADDAAAATAGRTPLFELELPLIVVKAISYLGLGAGIGYLLLQLARFPVSATNTRRVLLQGWHNLISLLTARKRRRPWGTVYDSATKAPVDPAYVELFDTAGQKRAEAITDLDGRYGFLVPEGVYTMQVRKTNYLFPSRHTTLGKQDVIYSQLYFGGPISVSSTVVHDVPMDPVDFDWNQYEKLRTKQTRYFHLLDPLIVRFFDFMFFVGAGFMAWQFFNNINLYTSFLLSCYLVLLVARFMGNRPVLYGAISEDGLPLQFAMVHIMQADTTIVTKVTDAYGRYVAIVPPDTYTVRVEKRLGEDHYVPVFERKIRAKHGVINARLRV